MSNWMKRGQWLGSVCCLLALVACGSGSAGSGSGAGAAQAPRAGGAEAGRAAPASQPASSQAAPASSATSPELQRLIDAARQEGRLSFVWGEGTLGGSQGIQRLADGFNRHYGLNIDVRFTPGPAMPNVAGRVVEEYQAGRQASTDVYVGYANHVYSIMQGDALAAVDWRSWAPNVQDPRLLAPDGMAVTFESSMQGITYNSQRVRPEDVPTSMEDLLKPQYKGRIASTPYASGFDRLAIPETWGEQRTLEYTRRLADQVAGLIRCNEKERLLSGEFDIFALDCSHNDAFRMRAAGAPINFQTASDAPFILQLYMGVPKNAPHPNAARLWVNYVLSREAQEMIWEREFSDSHLLEGSKMAVEVAKLQERSPKLLIVDVAFYQTHDEAYLNRVLNEIQKVLQKQ